MASEARAAPHDRWIVAALLALHAALALDAARRDSMTFDEPAFVAGGLSFLRTGDARLLEGGTLPEVLEALPLALAAARMPDDPAAWARSDAWTLAHALFYESGHGEPARLALLARLPVVAWSAATGLVVFLIARRLFGRGAAYVSLTLFALDPLVLAHGHVATADAAFALVATSCAWLFARCLRRLDARTLAASALALGAAFVTKVSALLLPAVLAAIAATWLLSRAPWPVAWRGGRELRSLRARLAALALVGVAHLAAVIAVAWLANGLRYSAFRSGPGELKEGGWEAHAGAGALEPLIAAARRHELMPEAWLYGFQYTLHRARARPAFALGQWSETGWWWFFPVALALKTPLATLALVLAGVAALPIAWAARRRLTPQPRGELAAWARTPWGADLLALSPLLALLLVYWGAAIPSALNIGARHVLPTLPATLVLAGAAWRLPGPRAVRAGVIALAIVAAIEGATAHPHQLAWMNAAAGPADLRWTRLVDSSLDWGQDARRLAAFVRREKAAPDAVPVYVAWFGSADPAGEGVDARLLPSFLDWHPEPLREPLRPGTYCVSASALVQLYANFPGEWARPYEDAWRRADDRARPYLEGDTATRAALEAERGGEYWDRLLTAHDQLRLGRLCQALRHRRADETLGGGSILVFRLGERDVEDALRGPPRELIDAPGMTWVGQGSGGAPEASRR